MAIKFPSTISNFLGDKDFGVNDFKYNKWGETFLNVTMEYAEAASKLAKKKSKHFEKFADTRTFHLVILNLLLVC